jgi:hypothetical protein
MAPEYLFKDQHLWSKVRAFYARAFNPRYLENYTTTIYPRTFFPGRMRDGPEYRMVKIEQHENVHKFDRWNEGFKFNLKYLFPQWLAMPFLLAVVGLGGPWSWVCFGGLLVLLHVGLAVLALAARGEKVPGKAAYIAFGILSGLPALACLGATILWGKWFALLWLPVVLFTLPWPIKARWRRDYELRGYTMSLYIEWLKHGNVRGAIIDHYVKGFTGPAYVWMETNGDYVRKELLFQTNRFRQNAAGFLEEWAWMPSGPKRKGEDASKLAIPYRESERFMRVEGLIRFNPVENGDG